MDPNKGKIVRRRRRAIMDLPVHLLEKLRLEGPMSRVQLARSIGIGPATAGNYVEKMIESGLLREREDSADAYSGKGRPPTMVDLNPSGGVIVGVDVVGPVIRAVRFDFCLEIRQELEVPFTGRRDRAALRRKIVDAIERVRPEPSENWLGIGIAFPGLVDAASGSAEDSDFLPGFACASVAEHFGVPAFMDNDMCCIAYGERLLGKGRSSDYFACVASRAGWTAAAIFANGELTSGPQRGINISKWLLPVDAKLLPEVFQEKRRGGTIRCSLRKLSSRESVLAIYEHFKKRAASGKGGASSECPDFEAFCELLEEGDGTARASLEPLARALGRVVARIDDIMNFDQIVFNGFLVRFGDPFLEQMKSFYEEYRMEEVETESAKLSFSDLGHRAGPIGAAGLVLRNWQPSTREPAETAEAS